MKKYKLIVLWADGTQTNLGTVETANPKHTLFNTVCELIVTSQRFYDVKNPDGIMKGIWQGILDRQSYHFEANDNVVSIMEVR